MKKVFVVGDINLDILCSVKKIPKLNTETSLKDINFSVGGNAANSSIAFSNLGVNTKLIASMGKDFASRFLLNELKKAGLKTDLIKENRKNGYSIVLVDLQGNKRILSTKQATAELNVKKVRNKLLSVNKNDLVYFGGFFHLPKLRTGFASLLKDLKKTEVIIAFDVCFDRYNGWKVKDFLKYVDFFFLNETELKKITREKNKRKAIKRLFSWHAKEIILKLGERGSEYYSEKVFFKQKVRKIKCIDSTGAGDVFSAAFLFSYLKGFSPKNCLRFAGFVAEKKIQKHGLIIPSKKESNSFMKRLKN